LIDGAVLTDLGGTSFGALRSDVLLPVLTDLPGADVFVFADVGSVWGLDSAVPPSGTLQDTSDLRTSVGLGASYDFALGRLEGYLASPVSSQTGDQEQVFGLTFRAQF
jgi:outer membrane protein assembly factor BamA